MLNEALGATKEIELGGKVYKASELTLGDLADFEEWVGAERRRHVIESARGMQIKPRDILEAANKPISKTEIDDEMEKVTGARYLLWLVLRRHNDVCLTDLSELVTMSNLEEVLSVILGTHEGNEPTPAATQ
ncbi:MAG: hypothetical protein GY841_08685 [FCB group bacterium]|nr:hypothetical protein [FCB group bacterium]